MVLLTVVWASVLLAVLVLPAVDDAVSAARLNAADFDRLTAEWAARAGIARACAELAADPRDADGLSDRWSSNDLAFHEVKAGARARYSVRAGGDGHRTPRFGVVDEDRKLGLFGTPDAVLARVPGLTPALLERLAAVRKSAGSTPRRSCRILLAVPAFGPEAFYGEDWNEDGLLQENEDDGDRSLPPDDANGVLRRGLSHWLSPWTDGRVNVNTADVEVLAALPGLAPDQAARLVEARARGGRPAASVAALVQAAGLSGDAAKALAAVGKVTSEVFHVTSTGEVTGSTVRVTIEAVVRRRDSGLERLYTRRE